ncbi:uncharacterized protein A4U43_UnF2560 [Asparagus officinalis]|uniref:Uncharacterized protein n=1 Tax=Asparagus officinalis TaxID=4686 RepID=A0A1R3L782_ASPOF|nr:uncharacterized protein A4U43_UnF2560 [Asparagus officinalis]
MDTIDPARTWLWSTPGSRGAAAEVGPEGEEEEDRELLKGVSGYEAEVHGEGVVGGDEVEGEQRDGEERDEAVDAGALIGAEDLPPFHGAVGEDHRHVEGNHGRHHMVEIRWSDHLLVGFSSFF